ncbi:MAG: hypothetical protein J5644_04825 [Bacteroidales bacterium]|nr:hypothetical protein [Bacteroidales bacterium]
MFDDVKIKEFPFTGTDGQSYKISIMTGGFSSPNPGAYMDEFVRHYTKHSLHNQFLESHLDMPWVRVVVSGINEIPYDVFKNQRLDDNKR